MTTSHTPNRPPAHSFEARLQARLDAFEAEPARNARRLSDTEPAAPVLDLDDVVPGQPAIDELNRQVKVLRHQLKEALEEVDRRVLVAVTRVEVAERRAVQAEASAASALDALRRLEEGVASASSLDPDEHHLRLRAALNQLKARASARS